ncbi:hypothetical protein MLD38_022430 [Melastoma candidum]|uniref:Uncharacterized protein n=1 Tax=Melastoma candidum TaxID=119954 RepID=A0ACB9QJ41_9MYRT|nr:hypothetical protein MLD38_022430 [Melastoma candidum]
MYLHIDVEQDDVAAYFLADDIIIGLRPFRKRTFLAPHERLKWEYIVRREQKNIVELIKKIAITQESSYLGFQEMMKLLILRNSWRALLLAHVPTAKAATYPFEVVRLQLQDQAIKLSAFATLVKIVKRGGVPALYAGLVPSLLQVWPCKYNTRHFFLERKIPSSQHDICLVLLHSAAISYFVYELKKLECFAAGHRHLRMYGYHDFVQESYSNG